MAKITIAKNPKAAKLIKERALMLKENRSVQDIDLAIQRELDKVEFETYIPVKGL